MKGTRLLGHVDHEQGLVQHFNPICLIQGPIQSLLPEIRRVRTSANGCLRHTRASVHVGLMKLVASLPGLQRATVEAQLLKSSKSVSATMVFSASS